MDTTIVTSDTSNFNETTHTYQASHTLATESTSSPSLLSTSNIENENKLQLELDIINKLQDDFLRTSAEVTSDIQQHFQTQMSDQERTSDEIDEFDNDNPSLDGQPRTCSYR